MSAILPSSGSIPVIGAPAGFDLGRAIRAASSVYVVTAFAHFSGWRLIRNSLLKSDCQMVFIAGLDFFHTEPGVLWDWIGKDFADPGGYVNFEGGLRMLAGRSGQSMIGTTPLSWSIFGRRQHFLRAGWTCRPSGAESLSSRLQRHNRSRQIRPDEIVSSLESPGEA